MLSNGKPVVALDIDGTLGRYHQHFTYFAAQWSGRALAADWYRAEDRGRPGSFSAALGMSKPQYRACKLAYRQGGMKRSMPVFDGAADLTRFIRKAGAEVWICTTRPYQRLDNIDPDTRHWARRNGVQYDHMIYGEGKYRELVACVGADRIVAALDDLPEQIEAARKVGIVGALLHDGPHNWHYQEVNSSLPTLLEARQEILGMIQLWNRANK